VANVGTGEFVGERSTLPFDSKYYSSFCKGLRDDDPGHSGC
jgi:hypothetical protein